MLPGFRILFAMVVLSIGLLVFGLGAFSLLRSVHHNVAGQPNSFSGQPAWHAPADPAVASANDRLTNTLALLRVETPATAPVIVTPAPSIQRDLAAPASEPSSEQPRMAAPAAEAGETVPSISQAETEPAANLAARTDSPPAAAPDGGATGTTPEPVASTDPVTTAAPPQPATDRAAIGDSDAKESLPATTDTPEPKIQIAALPDRANAEQAASAGGGTKRSVSDVKPAKQKVRDLRAERRARARIRARRLAIARARAARLAQTNQQNPAANATANAPFNNNPFATPTMR